MDLNRFWDLRGLTSESRTILGEIYPAEYPLGLGGHNFFFPKFQELVNSLKIRITSVVKKLNLKTDMT